MGKTTIILQARMSSKRLPGKVLMNIASKPLIEYVIKRLQLVQCAENLIIATSTDPSDDPLAEYLESYGIKYYRGSLNDVSSRFVKIINQENLNSFVRISADSPILDPKLIDSCWQRFEKGYYDLVTNCQIRSFPKGQSVEIVKADTFLSVYNKFKSNEDLEHVTKYFYNNPQDFNIFNLACPDPCGNLNHCVDTLEDFEYISKLISKAGTRFDSMSWEEFIELERSCKALVDKC